MRRAYLISIFISTLVIFNSNTQAAIFRVDDSATLPGESQTKMRWRSLGPNHSNGDVVDGAALITIRLKTLPWINRVGKIYMVLPQQPIGQVLVDWTTQGNLLSGALISGNRTLVYAGQIHSAMIEDTINIQVHSDGKRLVSAQKLEFHFEIDMD